MLIVSVKWVVRSALVSPSLNQLTKISHGCVLNLLYPRWQIMNFRPQNRFFFFTKNIENFLDRLLKNRSFLAHYITDCKNSYLQAIDRLHFNLDPILYTFRSLFYWDTWYNFCCERCCWSIWGVATEQDNRVRQRRRRPGSVRIPLYAVEMYFDYYEIRLSDVPDGENLCPASVSCNPG